MALLLTTLLIAAAPQIHASTTSSGRHIPILLRPLDSSPGGFDPPIVSASPGDVLEFHFLKGNHSVALGDWDAPCNPAKSGGFFSGFQPVADGENVCFPFPLSPYLISLSFAYLPSLSTSAFYLPSASHLLPAHTIHEVPLYPNRNPK